MAMRTTAALPDDLITLKALIVHERATHTTALSARDEEIERLRAQMRVLLAQRFGTMRGKNIVSIWNCDEFLLEKTNVPRHIPQDIGRPFGRSSTALRGVSRSRDASLAWGTLLPPAKCSFGLA